MHRSHATKSLFLSFSKICKRGLANKWANTLEDPANGKPVQNPDDMGNQEGGPELLRRSSSSDTSDSERKKTVSLATVDLRGKSQFEEAQQDKDFRKQFFYSIIQSTKSGKPEGETSSGNALSSVAEEQHRGAPDEDDKAREEVEKGGEGTRRSSNEGTVSDVKVGGDGSDDSVGESGASDDVTNVAQEHPSETDVENTANEVKNNDDGNSVHDTSVEQQDDDVTQECTLKNGAEDTTDKVKKDDQNTVLSISKDDQSGQEEKEEDTVFEDQGPTSEQVLDDGKTGNDEKIMDSTKQDRRGSGDGDEEKGDEIDEKTRDIQKDNKKTSDEDIVGESTSDDHVEDLDEIRIDKNLSQGAESVDIPSKENQPNAKSVNDVAVNSIGELNEHTPASKAHSIELSRATKGSISLGKRSNADPTSESPSESPSPTSASPPSSPRQTRPFIPEFLWSPMHQRLLADILFAIESDLQVWKRLVNSIPSAFPLLPLALPVLSIPPPPIPFFLFNFPSLFHSIPFSFQHSLTSLFLSILPSHSSISFFHLILPLFRSHSSTSTSSLLPSFNFYCHPIHPVQSSLHYSVLLYLNSLSQHFYSRIVHLIISGFFLHIFSIYI